MCVDLPNYKIPTVVAIFGLRFCYDNKLYYTLISILIQSASRNSYLILSISSTFFCYVRLNDFLMSVSEKLTCKLKYFENVFFSLKKKITLILQRNYIQCLLKIDFEFDILHYIFTEFGKKRI